MLMIILIAMTMISIRHIPDSGWFIGASLFLVSLTGWYLYTELRKCTKEDCINETEDNRLRNIGEIIKYLSYIMLLLFFSGQYFIGDSSLMVERLRAKEIASNTEVFYTDGIEMYCYPLSVLEYRDKLLSCGMTFDGHTLDEKVTGVSVDKVSKELVLDELEKSLVDMSIWFSIFILAFFLRGIAWIILLYTQRKELSYESGKDSP